MVPGKQNRKAGHGRSTGHDRGGGGGQEATTTYTRQSLEEMSSSATVTRVLTDAEASDLRALLTGTYWPLDTYMTAAQYASVLTSCRLPDGAVFPIPVTLWCEAEHAPGTVLSLVDTTGIPLASLAVTESFDATPDAEALALTGTRDDGAHPYVAMLQARPCVGVYVSGRLTPLLHCQLSVDGSVPAVLRARTVAEVRELLRSSGAQGGAVIGVQTRNPLHGSHLALIQWAYDTVAAARALPDAATDATALAVTVLLHPVTGPTQPGDVPPELRMRSYRACLPLLPPHSLLAFLDIPMRMAGPREAVWHAVIRRNFGCTHFVVGRDHAGPSSRRSDTGAPFYGVTAAQQLAAELAADVGITILCPPREFVYNAESKRYELQALTEDGHGGAAPSAGAGTSSAPLAVSGSAVRSMLERGEAPPEWFVSPQVAAVLLRKPVPAIPKPPRGVVVYIVGIPASGKSTLAREVVRAITTQTNWPVTLLDADEVRRHLSRGLGLSDADRSENVRRIGYVAAEVARHGGVAVVANIAPMASDRAANRAAVRAAGGKYVEVFMDTDVSVCRERDPKGLYARHAAQLLPGPLTGVDGRFDRPVTSTGIRAYEDTGSTPVSLSVSPAEDVWVAACRVLRFAGLLTVNRQQALEAAEAGMPRGAVAADTRLQVQLNVVADVHWWECGKFIRPSARRDTPYVLSCTSFKAGRHTLETMFAAAQWNVTGSHAPPDRAVFPEEPDVFVTAVRDPVDQYLSALFEDIANPAYPYAMQLPVEDILKLTPEDVFQHLLLHATGIAEVANPMPILEAARARWGVDLVNNARATGTTADGDALPCFRFNTETLAADVKWELLLTANDATRARSAAEAWYAPLYAKCRQNIHVLRRAARWLYTLPPALYADPCLDAFDNDTTLVLIGSGRGRAMLEMNHQFKCPPRAGVYTHQHGAQEPAIFLGKGPRVKVVHA